MLAEDLGVLIQRDERVVARATLMGHQHDAMACCCEFADRCRVSLEAAVVLYLAVLDRGVQVKADEDALCVVESVDSVEGCHWCVGNQIGQLNGAWVASKAVATSGLGFVDEELSHIKHAVREAVLVVVPRQDLHEAAVVADDVRGVEVDDP